MGDREFKNPYEDYKEDDKVFNFETNKLEEEIAGPLKQNALDLLAKLEKHLADETESSNTCVYTGTSGIALLYMHLMDSKHFSDDKDFMKSALSYIEPFISSLRKKDGPTFLCGVSGPLAIAAVLYHRKGMKTESHDLARRLENLEKDACSSDTPDELLYGRVGFLYSLLFLNKHLGQDEFRDNVIKEVVNVIFESGKRFAKKFCNTSQIPLFYEWHNSPYVGPAHGFSGIMYMLLQAKEYLTSEQLTDLVKPTIDFVLSIQYPSGNYPSSLGSKTDKLVHWCHGAPGVIHMLLLAYEVFNEDKYLESAQKCGDVVWSRGILKKGYGICHGVAGNGYAHLRLFQVTKEPKHLYRAVKFAEWCYAYGTHGCRRPDKPYSLFEGMAGTVYYLFDLLEPLNSAFPAFQLF